MEVYYNCCFLFFSKQKVRDRRLYSRAGYHLHVFWSLHLHTNIRG